MVDDENSTGREEVALEDPVNDGVVVASLAINEDQVKAVSVVLQRERLQCVGDIAPNQSDLLAMSQRGQRTLRESREPVVALQSDDATMGRQRLGKAQRGLPVEDADLQDSRRPKRTRQELQRLHNRLACPHVGVEQEVSLLGNVLVRPVFGVRCPQQLLASSTDLPVQALHVRLHAGAHAQRALQACLASIRVPSFELVQHFLQLCPHHVHDRGRRWWLRRHALRQLLAARVLRLSLIRIGEAFPAARLRGGQVHRCDVLVRPALRAWRVLRAHPANGFPQGVADAVLRRGLFHQLLLAACGPLPISVVMGGDAARRCRNERPHARGRGMRQAVLRHVSAGHVVAVEAPRRVVQGCVLLHLCHVARQRACKRLAVGPCGVDERLGRTAGVVLATVGDALQASFPAHLPPLALALPLRCPGRQSGCPRATSRTGILCFRAL
mmetsp:Transcript_2096/g.5961  ORF Transcript_2096/g.5961 Transcript_2096/m.5961 type:complete len:441 (+) Transcript_2096:1068-2390(+)